MPGGRPRKSLQQHLRDGTYRRDRHGPLPGEEGVGGGAGGEAGQGVSKPVGLSGAAATTGAGKPVTKDVAVGRKVATGESSADESALRDALAAMLSENLTDRDMNMLGDLAWWWTELRRIQGRLKEMVPGEKGYKDVLTSAGIAIDKVDKIGAKFGLTPGDRARLGVVSSGPPVAKVPVKPKTKLDRMGPPK